MYQENNNTINWIKVIVKILLAFLVVILSVKLISLVINNKDKNNVENVMESNLTQMMEVAKDYFKEDKLPKQVGKSTKVDLETLIKDKKISTLKDSKGKECDLNESFIKATRLDKEYQIKAYLVCNKETDYYSGETADTGTDFSHHIRLDEIPPPCCKNGSGTLRTQPQG